MPPFAPVLLRQVSHAAAVHKRRVSVSLVTEAMFSGYIVGVDDTHLLMYVTQSAEESAPEESLLVIALSSVTHLRTNGKHKLFSEPEEVQDEVSKIGAGFWAVCRQYLASQGAFDGSARDDRGLQPGLGADASSVGGDEGAPIRDGVGQDRPGEHGLTAEAGRILRPVLFDSRAPRSVSQTVGSVV